MDKRKCRTVITERRKTNEVSTVIAQTGNFWEFLDCCIGRRTPKESTGILRSWGNRDWKSIKLFSSVQSFSRVRLFATTCIAVCRDSLSIANFRSLPKSMSIELVMPSKHLILCCPLLPLPSISPSIRFFSNESVPPIRWPKYWNCSFSVSPSNEHSGLMSFRMDWLALLKNWVSWVKTLLWV